MATSRWAAGPITGFTTSIVNGTELYGHAVQEASLTLPHTASHLKLCQFMSSHLASPQAIADHTEVPLHTVHRFCNACEALGLVAIKTTALECNERFSRAINARS